MSLAVGCSGRGLSRDDRLVETDRSLFVHSSVCPCVENATTLRWNCHEIPLPVANRAAEGTVGGRGMRSARFFEPESSGLRFKRFEFTSSQKNILQGLTSGRGLLQHRRHTARKKRRTKSFAERTYSLATVGP